MVMRIGVEALNRRLSGHGREVYKIMTRRPRFRRMGADCWGCKGQVVDGAIGPLRVVFIFTRKEGSVWQEKRVEPLHLGCLFHLTGLP